MSAKSPIVAVVCAAGLLVLSGSAAAPARLRSASLAELNSIRAHLGLSRLQPNPVAARLVSEIAARDVADVPPEVLDSQPDCAVCEVVFDRRGVALDPRRVYAGRGGAGAIDFALWRRGWSAAQNLSVFFRAAALVLDPRARTFSAATTPRGLQVLAITIDPAARFQAPVRWPRGAVDPRRQLWAEIVLPPGLRGRARLSELRGGKDVTVAYPLAETLGLGGARLVAFGLNATLAYRHRYAVRVHRLALLLRTGAGPRDFFRRSWTFASTAPSDRRMLRTVVRRSPRPLRALLAEIDGAVRIVGQGRSCSIADACEHDDGGKVTLSFRRLTPFVAAHELGHAVFDLALDEPGRRFFLRAFVRAGWRGAGSTPLSEIFADQLAFWALGGVPAVVNSYSDRMYLSAARFAELLEENGSYRPLATVGLLKR